MLNVKRTSVYDVTKVFKRMVYQDADISIPYGLYIPKNYEKHIRFSFSSMAQAKEVTITRSSLL